MAYNEIWEFLPDTIVQVELLHCLKSTESVDMKEVNKMNIYVQMLEEGTPTYRPVESTQLSQNVFKLEGETRHDPEDEIWEFLPGTVVEVELRKLFVGLRLVALRKFVE